VSAAVLSEVDRALLGDLHARARCLPDPGRGWRYRGHQALVLAHGRLFTPSPWDPARPKGLPKRCFANALRLAAVDPTLVYVEGYAHIGLLPVPHAWCARPDGTVADPTWPDEVCAGYLGIPLATWFVQARMVKTGHLGVLAGDWHDDFWLLRHGLPEAAILAVGRPLPTGGELR
jgi:hypothetical protein